MKMNQSEAFIFLTSCEFFLLGGGRENTNKKPRQYMHFQFPIKKMKIKIKVNSKIDV